MSFGVPLGKVSRLPVCHRGEELQSSDEAESRSAHFSGAAKLMKPLSVTPTKSVEESGYDNVDIFGRPGKRWKEVEQLAKAAHHWLFNSHPNKKRESRPWSTPDRILPARRLSTPHWRPWRPQPSSMACSWKA